MACLPKNAVWKAGELKKKGELKENLMGEFPYT